MGLGPAPRARGRWSPGALSSPAGSRVLHPRSRLAGSATRPRGADRGSGLQLRTRGTFPGEGFGAGVGEREPRSTLAQVAQRELRIQRVNHLPGHLPTSAPNSGPPHPLCPLSIPRSPSDTPATARRRKLLFWPRRE